MARFLLSIAFATTFNVALGHNPGAKQHLTSFSAFAPQERLVRSFLALDSLEPLVSLANLTTRALECEPGTTPCADGIHCAIAGTFCCEGDNAHGCSIGETCCLASSSCAPVGSYCCADSSGSCIDGSTCCPNSSKCARIGETCCGSGVCDVGQTCCANGAGCADEGYTCCGNSLQCAPEAQCCVDEDGDYFCAECVPSLIFPYAKDFLDEIYVNMCKGTAGSSSTTDPNSAIVTLKKDTDQALRRAKASNRRAAGCAGPTRITCPPGTNCDESPFASTYEGGSGANIMCGTYYNTWLSEQIKLGNLVRGGQYRIVLKNIDCSKYPLKRLGKRAEPNGVLLQNGNTTLLAASLFGNQSSQNALLIDLTKDQNTPGTYTLDYDITQGSIVSGAIVDDDGEYLANVSAGSTGSKANASVDLEEDYGDIHFVGWTNDKDVSVSYGIKVALLTSTSTSAAQTASTTRSSGMGTATSSASPTATASAASTAGALTVPGRMKGGLSGILAVLIACLI
ncbi:hypothetical protein B0A48_17222 [Cryoendolithus antarcticus]|uniref:Deoxyribonuclease NucA/NucB domain-containing protein n=1 Tax=Cryoendolithus antarcticus TaxID=1507870 RepID=A0A1V8SD96_9PEZI|nr:hypothetical protein B0A48_17222 [Cryoendolithus antarcticus]